MSCLLLLAVPLFVEGTDRLGDQPCGPGGEEGCYTNYVQLADLDGDGDLDVLFPNADGYYQQGPAEPLVLLRNDGSGAFEDVSATAFGGFTGWLRQVAIGDVDGDADLDLFAPDAWAGDDALFVNDGQGAFTDQAATRIGTASRAGAARFGDLDGDGDLDLVVSDWGSFPPTSQGSAVFFRNDGAGAFEPMEGAAPRVAAPDGTGPIDLDLFDADGDFDLDLLIDSRVGNAQLWRNDGTGTFEDASGQLPNQPSGYAYGPSACDVDGDGDLDLWIDNGTAEIEEQLLINGGAGTFSDETDARVTGNETVDDNGVVCADVDGDRDLDAVIAALGDGSTQARNERLFVNDGTGHFALHADAFPLVGDFTLWIDLGDLDGDGRLDAVTAQGESGAYLNRLYLGTTAAPVDDDPPAFRAVQAVAGAALGEGMPVRFGVSDAVTTDLGPRLTRAWIEVTAGEETEEIDAVFVGGDLFQATLPNAAAGTVAYRACATDREGNSGCSAAQSYEVAPDGSGGGNGGAGCGCHLSANGPSVATLPAMLVLAAALMGIRRGPRRG